MDRQLTSAGWKITIRLAVLMLGLVVAAATAEAISFVATKNGWFLINEPPGNHYGVLWRTERDIWSGWHKPSSSDRHVTQCIDVTYESNSVGARDQEFSREGVAGVRRAVLLGDSFAEGYGVDLASASQTFIEQYSQVEILNFGSAGETGPLHYYLLYNHLAREFDHDAVIVYLLPATDFRDNDYAAWAATPEVDTRYRPYWRRDGPDHFAIFYPPTAAPSDTMYRVYPEGVLGAIKWFVNEYTWSKNAYRTAQYLLSGRPDLSSYSGYFDASEEQQRAVVFYLKQIVAAAGGRNVIIVSIPDQRDIRALRRKRADDQLWYREITKLADSNRLVTFVDLAKHLPVDPGPLFLTCDPHWSPEGNRWAAAVVSQHLLAMR